MQVPCQVMRSEKRQGKLHPSKEIRSITTAGGLSIEVREVAAFGSRLPGFRARPTFSAIIRSGLALLAAWLREWRFDGGLRFL